MIRLTPAQSAAMRKLRKNPKQRLHHRGDVDPRTSDKLVLLGLWELVHQPVSEKRPVKLLYYVETEAGKAISTT